MQKTMPDNTVGLVETTRRHFLRDCRVGLGAMALGSLLSRDGGLVAATGKAADAAPKTMPHFPPQAKNVIFLFMAGGPSQLELFDHKSELQKLDGQVIPESYVENKRFAFLKKDAKLLGSCTSTTTPTTRCCPSSRT